MLSGDAPETVAAIARDVGIPVAGVRDGSAIPEDPEARRRFAADATVVGRISPDGKQAIVQALAEQGSYVAMVGDGVNDVPALKSARLAIAQGSGTQMARSVSDLVLVSGDFATVPPLVAEGRRALRNLQRVTKLYVTKSAFAAFLILTIGTSSDAYPLLPRHLSLAASLTIGIPTFFLALAPSSGPWRPDGFVRGVARFAIPAGVLVGTGLVAGYLFSVHDLSLSVADARTVALTTLIANGLYLVMALEAGGSGRRSTLVAGMCAVMAGLYVAALLIPAARSFFAVTVPGPEMIVTALAASAVSIGALALSGYSLGSLRLSRSDGARSAPDDARVGRLPRRRCQAAPTEPVRGRAPQARSTPRRARWLRRRSTATPSLSQGVLARRTPPGGPVPRPPSPSRRRGPARSRRARKRSTRASRAEP